MMSSLKMQLPANPTRKPGVLNAFVKEQLVPAAADEKTKLEKMIKTFDAVSTARFISGMVCQRLENGMETDVIIIRDP